MGGGGMAPAAPSPLSMMLPPASSHFEPTDGGAGAGAVPEHEPDPIAYEFAGARGGGGGGGGGGVFTRLGGLRDALPTISPALPAAAGGAGAGAGAGRVSPLAASAEHAWRAARMQQASFEAMYPSPAAQAAAAASPAAAAAAAAASAAAAAGAPPKKHSST
jgi:hypothetical protein